MLVAIVSQDAQQLTSLVMRLGAVPPGLDEAALSVDLSEFVVHYANQPVDSFDLAGALTRNDRDHSALSHRAALVAGDADQGAGDARRHGPAAGSRTSA